MRNFLPFFTLLFILSVIYGCDKEKIVTTTETVHDTQYIELPPDTIKVLDTLYLSDSIMVNTTDTLIVNTIDTMFLNSTDTLIVNTVDTLNQIQVVVDTVNIIHNVYDTVTVTQTVTITDTVIQNNNTPDASHAYSALQYYTDSEVLTFINSEFGVTDGWILYLSTFQNATSNPSSGVFDFFGYIDYWVTDWSSYYPLEYNWRVTYKSGDPSNPQNWQLADPPVAVNGNIGGVSLTSKRLNTIIK